MKQTSKLGMCMSGESQLQRVTGANIQDFLSLQDSDLELKYLPTPREPVGKQGWVEGMGVGDTQVVSTALVNKSLSLVLQI